MRKDLTDITLVIDRSGSMGSIKEEAQNGVNAFIADQQKEPGDALLTIVQFDTTYDFVCNGIPIKNFTQYTLDPRGMTALLDAVGRAINETGSRLSAMKEEDRPGLVAFVIVTDGHENSSHEFTKAQIKTMIETQTKQFSWKFTFLGASQDAFAEAAAIGITRVATANFSPQNVAAAYQASSSSLKSMRCASASGQSAGMNFGYSDHDRSRMENK